MKIGAHVSVAGGFYRGVENAQKIGAETFQIFGASPRQWQAKIPSVSEIKKYREALKKSGLGPVFIHSAYLVNLASPVSDLRKKSIASLTAHLKIAEALGAFGLIFHVGSSKKMAKEKGIDFIFQGIKEVLKNVKGKSKLILENDAGGGGKVGGLEEIAEIIKKVKSNRIDICFDTAHAFESGMIKEYSSAELKDFFSVWDKKIDLKKIAVIHANDSKTAAASHHDRHANIGEGYIGLSGFKNLSKVPHLKDIPWILEVPGFDGNGPDKKNIDILKKITK
ncbi:MAG: deoxyribonuclease IV [Candidatus Pacebacteria bacterium]|nr:deoxyribonuclease IV [Candidatus Paceibacterota bacterium]